MAKTFGQYTGGIQAIQGINEFGAQQAAGIQRLGEQLAGTITKTYDTLNQQNEENSANKELIKGQSGNLAAIKKLMDANPDTKDSPLSQSITEMIAKLDSAGDLNRGQLKGLLKSSEVFTSQLPLTMQLQDKAFLAQTTAGVQKALAALKNQTVKDSKGYDIPVPSFAGGSPEKYQKDLQTFFEQHKKDNPEVQLDVGKAVRDSVQLQIQRFTNDPDLTKADPTYKQHLIRGFEALGKRDALTDKLATQSSEEYGTGENIMEQVGAIAAEDRLSTTAPADIRRAEIKTEIAAKALEAQRLSGKTPVDSGDSKIKDILSAGEINKHLAVEDEKGKVVRNKNYEALKTSVPVGDTYRYIENDAKRAGTWNQAEYDKAVAADKVLEGNVNFYQRKAPNENAYYESLLKNTGIAQRKQAIQDPRVADFAKGDFGETGIPVNALKLAETLGFKRSDYGIGFKGFGETLPLGIGAVLAPAGYGEATNELPRALKDFFGRVKAGKYDKTTGVVDTGRPADAGKNDWIQPIRTKTVEALKPVWEQAGKAGEVSSLATAGAKPAEPEKPDIYSQGFDYKMTIPGVFVNERPLTYEEEKDGVRKWFEENHNGVVPTTIDAIYKTIRPEAALIIKTLPTGEKLMHTDKGWTQLTQMTQPKGMTSEEKSDEGLFNFGQIVEGRRVPVEAVKGSGIMVNGFFSGGKKRAEAFAQNLQDVATLNESVPLLVEQFKKFGHSFKLWNQVEQGLAQSHIAKIRAAIRVETVGTGPVALPEHEMIAKRLGDPNALFTLDANEISKLTAILSTAKTNLQRQGTGVNVTFRPPTVAGQNPIQQNRVANAANRDSK